ncbi:uncharacterized protein ASCRUDRAFT_76460, partial [Ascoidea rubescens DSM 1968]
MSKVKIAVDKSKLLSFQNRFQSLAQSSKSSQKHSFLKIPKNSFSNPTSVIISNLKETSFKLIRSIGSNDIKEDEHLAGLVSCSFEFLYFFFSSN